MQRPHISTRVGCLMAGIAFLATAAPALAQAEEDIIVTGRYGPAPADAQSLSQTVSYADLDLSTAAGRDILRHRLRLTARYLCDKLGESDTAASVGPSCRDAAAKDAMNRVGTIEAHFAPRGTSWVPHAAWAAPYPQEWYTAYPD
jgi:UrcA family protein